MITNEEKKMGLTLVEKIISELTPEKFYALYKCNSTKQALEIVSDWYYFARYSSFLFLDLYITIFNPKWIDNVQYKWEKEENYTKGALLITGGIYDKKILDSLLEQLKKHTQGNSFAIQGVLCAFYKIHKGTRFDGYYKKRMLEEAKKSQYYELIKRCIPK